MTPGHLLFIFNNYLSIFDIEALIRYGGLLLICLVVFANTGLFFCFFIPSGAVLFAAGIFAATGQLADNLFIICSLLVLSSVTGNLAGYWFGRRAGPALYRKKDSRFFRRQYLYKTEDFYNRHGGIALMAAFFLPIIRTFSPVVAGIIGLNFRRFLAASFVGSFAWISSFVFAGYFVGSRPVLKPWLRYIVIAFILLVTVPVVIRIVKELRKSGNEKDVDE
jgi:membrane-associated protein